MTKPSSALLLLVPLLLSCGATDAICPTDPPQVRIAEDSRTLPRGQSFSPSVNVVVCGGTQPRDFIGYWQSADPAVAAVDSLSGVVTALDTGSAYVFARYKSPAAPVAGTYDSVLVLVP